MSPHDPGNSPLAICPACHQEVVFVQVPDGKTCPGCGATFDVHSSTPGTAAPVQEERQFRTWTVLLASLVAPSVLTLLAALARSQEASVVFTFLLSLAAALFGAIWLVMRLRLDLAVRIILAIVLAPVFYLGCVALCFAGCALGGGFSIH